MNLNVTTVQIPVTISTDEAVINTTISVSQPVINVTYGPVSQDGLTALYADYVALGGTLTYEQFYDNFIQAPLLLENAVQTTKTDW